MFVCLFLHFLIGILLKEVGDFSVRRHVSGSFFFVLANQTKKPHLFYVVSGASETTQVAGKSVEQNTKSLLVKSMDGTNIGCHTDNCSSQQAGSLAL